MRGTAYELLREAAMLLPECIARFLPRKSESWVFGAWLGKRYADNSRYLFEYVSDNCPEIEATWISSCPQVVAQVSATGRRAALAATPHALKIVGSAGVVFITHDVKDVIPAVSRGAVVVNLTHGTPFKKIGLDANSDRFGRFTRFFDANLRPMLPSFRRPDYVIAASLHAQPRFATAFGLDLERVIVLGYPRWTPYGCAALSGFYRERLCGGREFSRVILYAPTHRRSGRGQIDISSIEGFDEFLEWLRETNSLLVFRPHYALRTDADDELVRRGCGNIVIAREDVIPDINDALGAFDCLISDYSSLIYDFALLGRPIVGLPFDIAEYISQDAGLYADYEDEFPGLAVRRWNDVPRAISDNGERLNKFMRTHTSLASNDINRRIVLYVKSLL